MTVVTNPRKASWVNATQGTDQSGNAVAWDANSDLAAVEIKFDGQAAIDVPVAGGATSLDLTTVDAYKALPAGQHSIQLAEVTKEGAVSDFTASVPFQVAVVPLAPTSLVLA